MDNIRLLYIDLFCGAGGTSTGVEKANYKERKCAKVIACVNHDANAIASHAANHPEAQHYTEDMRTLDLRPLAEHTAEMRRMYPMAKVVLWASLECTNFSRAKGGQPRHQGLRILPWAVYKHAKAILPEVIIMENVEEIQQWGPLDATGRPIKERAGEDYNKFISSMCSLGYAFDSRELVAADYGAPTTRKRWYAILKA
jgi:DNA (cytosine-5)-methyltransferase 1